MGDLELAARMVYYALKKGDAYLRFIAEDALKMAMGDSVEFRNPATFEDAVLFARFILGDTRTLEIKR